MAYLKILYDYVLNMRPNFVYHDAFPNDSSTSVFSDWGFIPLQNNKVPVRNKEYYNERVR